MSWLNKESIPAELKDLGMTPAEIAQAVKDKKDLEAKILEKDGKLTAIDAEFTATKARVTELEKNQKPPEKPADPNNPPLTHFFDDPDKAFAERSVPLAIAAMQANANVAKLNAKFSLQGQFLDVTQNGAKRRISLASLYSRYEKEIDEAAKTMPLQQLGSQQTWINLFNYVKGNHLGEFLDKTDDFLEPVGVSVNSPVIQNNTNPDKLNTEEANAVAKMARYGKGVTAEKYQEMKKKMKFVGE
jgi:hypothetical protein